MKKSKNLTKQSLKNTDGENKLDPNKPMKIANIKAFYDKPNNLRRLWHYLQTFSKIHFAAEHIKLIQKYKGSCYCEQKNER